MQKFLPLFFILTLLLGTGCGSGGNGSGNRGEGNQTDTPPADAANRLFAVAAPAECSLKSRKQFVYDVLHDSYLWADETAEIDYEENLTYPDEQAVLDALRHPRDRFSFIISQKEYDDFFEAGKNVGYGFYFQAEGLEQNLTALRILLVYPGSAADRAGLRRSDQIVGIDSYTVHEVIYDKARFSHYFEGNATMTTTFHVKRANGNVVQMPMTRSQYDVKSVIAAKVLQISEHKKIGYLLFQSFVGTSQQELREAFRMFQNAGIEDLVLDLRYNGGGYIYIANQLASWIGGQRSDNYVFNQTVFNRRYSKYNTFTRFQNLPNSLSLPRVYILSTRKTCSASELVINAFRARSIPVDVIQIGDRTCGKPYGMYPLYFCSKYLLAVNMKSSNADYEGDYVEGLIPVCSAVDDIYHDFSDQNETMLATALYHIQHGKCPAQDRSATHLLTRHLTHIIEKFREAYAIY